MREDLKALDHLSLAAANAIIDDIKAGNPLRVVAGRAGVCRAALEEWMHGDSSRWEHYNRARTRRATDMAEDTIEIADNGAATSAPDAARDKLRIQARQWLASRWDRTIYGERSGPSVEVNVANMYLNAMRNVQPVDTAAVTIEHAPTSAEPEA